MTKEEHQRILFGNLYDGVDKPLKFIKVTEEERERFKRTMEGAARTTPYQYQIQTNEGI